MSHEEKIRQWQGAFDNALGGRAPYKPDDRDRAELTRVINEGSLRGKVLSQILPPAIDALEENGSKVNWFTTLQVLVASRLAPSARRARARRPPENPKPFYDHASHMDADFHKALRDAGFSQAEINYALSRPSRFVEERQRIDGKVRKPLFGTARAIFARRADRRVGNDDDGDRRVSGRAGNDDDGDRRVSGAEPCADEAGGGGDVGKQGPVASRPPGSSGSSL